MRNLRADALELSVAVERNGDAMITRRYHGLRAEDPTQPAHMRLRCHVVGSELSEEPIVVVEPRGNLLDLGPDADENGQPRTTVKLRPEGVSKVFIRRASKAACQPRGFRPEVAALSGEWSSIYHHVTIPLGRLTITVTLGRVPLEWEPRTWHGPGPMTWTAEHLEAKECSMVGSTGHLVVDDPEPGRTYALAWHPRVAQEEESADEEMDRRSGDRRSGLDRRGLYGSDGLELRPVGRVY